MEMNTKGLCMGDDIGKVFKELAAAGERAAARAFKGGLANMQGTAKELCPVGHYGRGRGKAGRQGGQLKSTLKTEYLGRDGTRLHGRAFSESPYAHRQHEGKFYHPGKYTRGAAGVIQGPYQSKFFERAFIMIFQGHPDPLNGLGAISPRQRRTFGELLIDAAKD